MTHYPTKKVILVYSLFGGSLGAFISFVAFLFLFITDSLMGFSVMPITSPLSEIALADLVVSFIFVFIFGNILGSVPALMTGCWVAIRKTVIHSKHDFLQMFKIIVLTVIVIGIPIVLISNEFNSDLDDSLIGLICWAILCGICAVILGWFVLPRSTKIINQNH